MAAWLDGVKFTPTLGGTTDFVVSTNVIGFMTPAQANAVNARVYKWHAESADLSQWEDFEGAYTVSGTVAARTTVLYNSSGTGTLQSGAGTKIAFSTVPTVSIVALKEDMISIEEANSFTAAQRTQARANVGAAINELQNVTFAVTAAAGALTIALKDALGNDATASTPITLSFRNATLAASPNTPSVLEVQAAASVVVPSTSTCGTTSATGCRLWIIGWNDGGTFRLGVFNASTANNIYALMDYAGGSSLQVVAAGNAAGQHYTAGAAVTNKSFRILGYVDWNSSGVATAGTWTTTNVNAIQTFGPGIPRPGTPTGTRSQSQTTTTDAGSTSTTYAASAFTGSIILSSAANAVKAEAFIVLEQAGTNNVSAKLQRGTSWTGASAICVNNGVTGSSCGGTSGGIDFPNSNGSVTYTVYRRTNNVATTANCPFINSATEPAVIILEEIMG